MTLEMFFTRLSKYSSICWCIKVKFITSNSMGLRADSKSVRKLSPFIELSDNVTIEVFGIRVSFVDVRMGNRYGNRRGIRNLI